MRTEALTITTSDGSTLHFETCGKPSSSHPSLVFLHYYGGSPSTWAPLLRQSHLHPFHKVLYHARGWAPSTGPNEAEAYSIAAMSSDLAAIIGATSLNNHESGFVLVGHSMGAKVAQHYAATAKPSHLKGLFLVAPAPLRGLQLPAEAKQQQRAAYQSAESVQFVLDNVLTAQSGALPAEVVRQVVSDSLRGNDFAKAAWPEYGMEEDYSELVREISVPVISLRGDKDFERDNVGLLGVDQGWSNKTVENCGHLIPLEQPEILASELFEFTLDISQHSRSTN